VDAVGYLAKAGFALAAAPVVLAAGARVARLERKLALGALVDELRRDAGRPLPRWLARPAWLAGTLERLLPVVPPYGYGPCLRRALILLDLWTRCGLAPTIHLGFRLRAPERDGHAWITAAAADGTPLQASGPNGTTPAFEL
jgi:hypothetical protein